MIRSVIPNLLTTLNLLCGGLAILAALANRYETAAILILAGALFDFLDGFAARLLKVTSPIGKQLDSLADLVTFGLAPAFMLHSVLKYLWFPEFNLTDPSQWVVLTPLLLIVFSAWRLAKFNIDDTQQYDFTGLPTPGNALFLVSFAFVLLQYPYMATITFVIPVIVFFSVLMVAPVPLFGLKNVKGRYAVYAVILLIVSVAAVFLFKFTAGVYIIPGYIVLSAVKNVLKH